jgi:ABC-type nitrate/sulfonate/bicarbonate transport system substrate-binding protein
MSLEISRRAALSALGSSLALLGLPLPARAADKLRVGKSVQQVFGYVPLDIGIKYGQFAKQSLDVEAIVFSGGTKLTQALTAGAVDVALSGGSEMAFIAKGAPELAVASITASPAFMGIDVGASSTARGLDDLKGKKIGITSQGTLTSWLVDELNRVKGWNGDERAVPVAIGGDPAAEVSAFKTGQIDANIASPANGYQLQDLHVGRSLVDVSTFVKEIQLFVIFASTAIVAQNPAAVRRFLAGWFDAVRFMRSHKAETVAVTVEATGYPADVSARIYDQLMNKFSTDGKFSQPGLEKLFASFADLNVIDKSTDTSKLYTERFLPKA